MVGLRIRGSFVPGALLAAMLVLGLGGCGDGDVKVVVIQGGGQKKAADTGADLGQDAPIGLWDPSPMVGREVRGPMTYAFEPAPKGSQPKQGGEVTFGILEDIDSFNPFLSSSVTASEVADQIFPRLMNEEPNYYDGVPTFTPQIAESWTIAPDNLSIRFTLRECSWSDGTPISSADVGFSVEAAKNAEVAWVSSSIVDFIRDVEVHSPREFTVHYTKAQPYNIMDINDVQVLPKHTFGSVPFGKWRGYGAWPELAKKACGGPFVVESHDPGERIVLARNPKYYDAPKPYVDRLIFVRFGSSGTMLNALLADQLDMMAGIIPEKAADVLEAKHLNLYTYVTRSYGYMGYNCKRWPFDDKRVRQAMTHAINRNNIVESIFAGYAQVAGPGIIRSMWASNRTIRPYSYDPDQAKSLLTEAGWKQNAEGYFEKEGKVFEFKLTTNQGNPTRRAICEYVQADLEKIGVKARLAITDFNQMSEQLKRHNFDAYVGGWNIATKIDPKPTFHSVSVNGRYNYVNFLNQEVDDIIDKGRVMNILDPSIRAEAKLLWDRFQLILADEQPYTMLYEPRGLVGLHKRFVNVRVTSLRALGNVHEWWIE